ncbi:MAG: hypothetical protein EXR83_09130 [Gammaproteobacteria bacterium]|nr:hypothetical protein [Gammaproteobacteria bacterium]
MRRKFPFILWLAVLAGGLPRAGLTADTYSEVETEPGAAVAPLTGTLEEQEAQFSTEIPLPPPFDPNYRPSPPALPSAPP